MIEIIAKDFIENCAKLHSNKSTGKFNFINECLGFIEDIDSFELLDFISDLENKHRRVVEVKVLKKGRKAKVSFVNHKTEILEVYKIAIA